MVGMVAVLLALFVAVGIAVKIYDAKRKREEQGVALQARLSDALLLNPTLTGVPVVASVHMPLRRSSPPRVELTGTVPTPEARETARRVVQHELDVKPDVCCPEITEVRCPLFTDVRVPWLTPRRPPPPRRVRGPAWACARATRPSSSPGAGSCRP